jgi:hypothetical protein
MSILENEMERATNNQYLLREEITDNIIIIKINRSYRRGMSPEELYDITRGCWKRRIESVDRAEFALAVYKGEVVEVYRIFKWYSALDEIRKTVPFDPNIERGRIIFKGEIAEEPIRKKYIGRNVSKLFKHGEASPIKTFYID